MYCKEKSNYLKMYAEQGIDKIPEFVALNGGSFNLKPSVNPISSRFTFYVLKSLKS